MLAVGDMTSYIAQRHQTTTIGGPTKSQEYCYKLLTVELKTGCSRPFTAGTVTERRFVSFHILSGCIGNRQKLGRCDSDSPTGDRAVKVGEQRAEAEFSLDLWVVILS